MSFQAYCAVCDAKFWHHDNRNRHRKNLTCKKECHDAQRVVRRREQRRKARMLKLAERHRAQLRRAHKPKRKGRKCRS